MCPVLMGNMTHLRDLLEDREDIVRCDMTAILYMGRKCHGISAVVMRRSILRSHPIPNAFQILGLEELVSSRS